MYGEVCVAELTFSGPDGSIPLFCKRARGQPQELVTHNLPDFPHIFHILAGAPCGSVLYADADIFARMTFIRTSFLASSFFLQVNLL